MVIYCNKLSVFYLKAMQEIHQEEMYKDLMQYLKVSKFKSFDGDLCQLLKKLNS
jgi:hypothetical protein